MKIIAGDNEQKVAMAFSRQAQVFDDIYASDKIIQYKRARVRSHVLRFIKPCSAILELNCGTGEDAIYFAQQGHNVYATDISSGMLDVLRKKVTQLNIKEHIDFGLCSFTRLSGLKNKGPYDLVFSNFGGLNCTNKLEQVLLSIDPLVKAGGLVTLVVIPQFCLWETLLFFKGKFKTAFRRFFNAKGSTAHIEGIYFKCWYYNPSYVIKYLKSFEVLAIEGLCTIVPPAYIAHFEERHPKIDRFLKRKENQFQNNWPWKCIGDYYIITLRKKI